MQQAPVQIIDSCFQVHGYAFRLYAPCECLPHDPGEQFIAQIMQSLTVTEVRKLHEDEARRAALLERYEDDLYREYYLDAVRHRVWRHGNRRRTKLDRVFYKTFGQRMAM